MFSRLVRLGGALFLASFLGACTTVPQDCRFADWEQVGFVDGTAGRPISALAPRIEDCIRLITEHSEAMYKKGRLRGLESYCRYENAIDLGLRGQDYRGSCPSLVNKEFTKRYDAARIVHGYRKDVAATQAEIESLEKDLRAAAGNEEQRRRIGDELKAKNQNLDFFRDKQRQAEAALDALR